MGEASRRASSVVPMNAKMTKALGELLNLARAGRLHGFAYVSIIEDADGDLAGGCNAIWEGGPAIHEAMQNCTKDLLGKLTPKKSTLIDPFGNALDAPAAGNA